MSNLTPGGNVVSPDVVTPEDAAAFLAELAALTVKHGIKIDACGCCGSPVLDRITAKSGSYTVNGYGEYLNFKETP
jgi:hypothetical protein